MPLPRAAGRFVEAWDALSQVRDGSVVVVSGFNLSLTPEYLIQGLYQLYRATGHPRDLFFIGDTFPGSPGRGFDWVAERLYKEEGARQEFIRGMLMAYYGWSRWLQQMIVEDIIEAYTWPICVLAHWLRDVGAGKPGTLSKVGLGTFIDPRQDGGALNSLAKERRTARVSVVEVNDEEYLFYSAPLPEVALIRGSRADDHGNIALCEEGIIGPVLQMAQAVKSRGRKGMVIAQILYPVRSGSINPKNVVIPGPLVDYIVKAPEDKHWQSATIKYDPRVSGQILVPLEHLDVRGVPLDVRKVIARRVLLEMLKIAIEQGREYVIVNLGVGIPSLVSNIAAEEGLSEVIVSTVESGPWGGLALHGADFGVAISPRAIIPLIDQFSIYEGGIIDAASLGFLQVDREGEVNASILPGRLTGPGGFPCISTGAPRLFFAGQFTAGKRDIRVEPEKGIRIVQDGPIKKFVNKVYKVLYCPCKAEEEGRVHLYITERAVFRLSGGELELIEVAPGVDLERDILEKMEFRPRISKKLEEMPKILYSPTRMGVAEWFWRELKR
ncbi:MAG: acyl CoA:acetate/3-ketoacid CoA transferase [Desulfurococcales archaeon]|nr:acyl CoA:acetate/3-ketoacid CoA transferase [Desulfurococcales archaeon]